MSRPGWHNDDRTPHFQKTTPKNQGFTQSRLTSHQQSSNNQNWNNQGDRDRQPKPNTTPRSQEFTQTRFTPFQQSSNNHVWSNKNPTNQGNNGFDRNWNKNKN